MKRKYRRLFVVIITLSIFAGSVVLVLGKLKNNVSFFYTPTELLSSSLINRPNIRIGGMVVKGTVQKYDDSIVFHITDLKNYIKVVYKGILPPLFSEGSWIVAKGKMVNGKFIASEILAKHDENYMPNKYKTNDL